MMDRAKSAEFLHASGLLYEINRLVLHPLGLALVVASDDDGHFDIAGLNKTDDPDGFVFGEDSPGPDKLKSFMEAVGLQQLIARQCALEFIVQPRPQASYVAVPGVKKTGEGYHVAQNAAAAILHDHANAGGQEQDYQAEARRRLRDD